MGSDDWPAHVRGHVHELIQHEMDLSSDVRPGLGTGLDEYEAYG